MSERVSESFILKRINELLISYISCVSVEEPSKHHSSTRCKSQTSCYFDWSSLFSVLTPIDLTNCTRLDQLPNHTESKRYNEFLRSHGALVLVLSCINQKNITILIREDLLLARRESFAAQIHLTALPEVGAIGSIWRDSPNSLQKKLFSITFRSTT